MKNYRVQSMSVGTKFRPVLCFAIVGYLGAVPAGVFAQMDNSWTGAAGNSDWFDSGNWSAGMAPNPAIHNPLIDSGQGSGPIISGSQNLFGRFRVGVNAVGNLVIMGGGNLLTGAAGNTVLGENQSGQGTVSVIGSGSILRYNAANNHKMIIGQGGIGILNLADGGALRVQGINAALRTLTLGELANSSGIINIGLGGGAGDILCFSNATTACSGNNRVTIAGGLGGGVVNFNHSSSDYKFIHDISGNVDVYHLGSGRTILDLSSYSYSGDTVISAGTLTFSNDTYLAGSVLVEAGGALAVHEETGGGRTGYVLHVGGDLSFHDGAIVDFGLGANADNIIDGVGDKIIVDGDLLLAGGLRVNDLGGFGNGVYSLFEYGGSVTGSMDVDFLPESYQGSIRLDLANNRVLLEVGAGLGDILYWNGADGVWDTATSNWTDFDSVGAGVWNGSFAVFRSAVDPVAMDVAVYEEVEFTGIQFMDNGFSIVSNGGGSLVATEAQTVVRADAGVTGVLRIDVSGNGLLKDGAGTIVLAGDGSWSAGTIVEAGTLQVGDGGVRGGISGNINNAAILAFNRSDDYEFDGVIRGGGVVRQDGEGTLVLTGANVYTGNTIISNGAVKVTGPLGSLGTGRVYLSESGSLIFDKESTLSIAQVIEGSGFIEVRGAGGVSFGADLGGFSGTLLSSGGGVTLLRAFGGDISSTNGVLSVHATVEGSVAASSVMQLGPASWVKGAVNVEMGGVLSGSGRVGSLTLQPGSSLAVGNSFGVLEVERDFTVDDGAHIDLEVDADGGHDSIIVGGRAIISGGSVLAVDHSAIGSIWESATQYVFLSAAEGVDGVFGGIASDLAFLDAELIYEANTVTLSLSRNDVRFGRLPGLNFNQQSVGNALEEFAEYGVTRPLVASMLSATNQEASEALGQLSGDFHVGIRGALLDEGRYVRDAVLTGSYMNANSNPLWVHVFSGKERVSANSAAPMDRNVYGVFIGSSLEDVDGEYEMGWAAGYHSSMDIEGDFGRSSARVNNVHASLYGGARIFDSGKLKLGLSHTWHEINVERSIVLPFWMESLESSYDGATLQAFFEASYKVPMKWGEFVPFLGGAYSRLTTESMFEGDMQRAIGETAALAARKQSSDYGLGNVGIRTRATLWDDVALVGSLGYRRTFTGHIPSLDMRLLDGGTEFSIGGYKVSRNSFVSDIGVSWKLTSDIHLGASYYGIWSNASEGHALRANLHITLP